MNVTGQVAEDVALALLRQHGLQLVVRNWRCVTGELDLVMRDGDVLVFVEVRARSSRRYGGALASLTAQKLARVQSAAQRYLLAYRPLPACRFDAVLIEGEDAPMWLKNIL